MQDGGCHHTWLFLEQIGHESSTPADSFRQFVRVLDHFSSLGFGVFVENHIYVHFFFASRRAELGPLIIRKNETSGHVSFEEVTGRGHTDIPVKFTQDASFDPCLAI